MSLILQFRSFMSHIFVVFSHGVMLSLVGKAIRLQWQSELGLERDELESKAFDLQFCYP